MIRDSNYTQIAVGVCPFKPRNIVNVECYILQLPLNEIH